MKTSEILCYSGMKHFNLSVFAKERELITIHVANVCYSKTFLLHQYLMDIPVCSNTFQF